MAVVKKISEIEYEVDISFNWNVETLILTDKDFESLKYFYDNKELSKDYDAHRFLKILWDIVGILEDSRLGNYYSEEILSEIKELLRKYKKIK